MTDIQQPLWLTQALAHRTPEHPSVTQVHIAYGQIRRLESMDLGTAQPRLVLVTDIGNELAVATVMGLSADIDSGSDVDRVLPRDLTGLPYDLIALPDVVGPAWFVQLGPALAVVEINVDDLPVAGIRVRDDLDSRWAWKERELDAFIALTAECRYQLIDGESAVVADPVAFDLALVDVAERSQMTLEIVRFLEQDAGFLPAEALALDPVAKDSKAYESFETLWRVVPRHSDRVLPKSSPAVGHAPSLRELSDDPLPFVLLHVAERLNESTRCIQLKTVSSLWSTDLPTPHTQYREVVLAGRRHQLVVSHVDVPEVHLV